MKALLLFLVVCIHGMADEWPGVKFAEVRAYYYNDEGAFFIPIIKNARLNPGVENPKGVLLTQDQSERLLTLLNTKRFESAEPGCFVPRHAFVFYDADQHVIATYEVCIHCHSQRGQPAGLAPVTDIEAIVALLKELHLRVDASYDKEDAWRDKWDPLKLVPFDEKTQKPNPALDPGPPEDPESVPASLISIGDTKPPPAARFSPWIEKDGTRYSGTYVGHISTMKLKITRVEGQFLANATSQLDSARNHAEPERKGTIWDEPLRFGKVVSFSQNALYAYIFCHYRRPDGRWVDGLSFLDRFYERKR